MTSVKDIVEEIILESKTSGSIFRNISPPFAYKYAKEALKKMNAYNMLYADVMNVKIPFACKVMKTPDFLHVIKVDLINTGGRTIEVRRSTSVPNEVTKYLLQCDGNLLIGEDNNALTDSCLTTNDETFKCICNYEPEQCTCKEHYYQDCETQQILYDLDKYQNSWFADKKNYVQFSADLEGMSVNIWYLKNDIMSVEECDLYVPENMTEALEYYVKYKLLEGNPDTIQVSQYYNREYRRLRDVALQQNNPVLKKDLSFIQFLK